jgi:hypothetical protein
MNILDRIEELKIKMQNFRRYRFVSEQGQIPYEWLCKFTLNRISHPRSNNVSKLEQFFIGKTEESLLAEYEAWKQADMAKRGSARKIDRPLYGRRFEDKNIQDRRKKTKTRIEINN